jgi:hypothetical protein
VARGKPKKRHVGARLDDFVAHGLASLMTPGEVVDAAVEQFEIHERTVWTAIARVKAQWREAEAVNIEDRRARLRAMIEEAWRGAAAVADFRAIAVMAKVLTDIEGVKAPKKVEHGGVIGVRPVAVMSPQERDREIEILLAKRQSALGSGAPPLPMPTPPRVIDVTPGEAELGGLAHDSEAIRVPAKTKSRGKTKAKKPAKPRMH